MKGQVLKDRKYYSWLLECPSSQRKIECDILRSTLKDLNISFYERFNNDNPRSFYEWISPSFPSRDHEDIKYQLCLETFNYYFYKKCRVLSNLYVDSQLTSEEKEKERINYSLLSTERELGNVDEIRYPKFNNLTLPEYRQRIFKSYLEDPPDSIEMKIGFSVTHISSNSILGIGILDEKSFNDETTNRVIDQFLGLENEFLPILLSQELPSKRQRKKLRNQDLDIFPYQRFKKISRLKSLGRSP